jgi:hypothetical protein
MTAYRIFLARRPEHPLVFVCSSPPESSIEFSKAKTLQPRDDLQSDQAEQDEQNQADSATSNVAETRTHAVSAKARCQDCDDKKYQDHNGTSTPV